MIPITLTAQYIASATLFDRPITALISTTNSLGDLVEGGGEEFGLTSEESEEERSVSEGITDC